MTGVSGLHCQRHQSVFEEDEVEEAAENQSTFYSLKQCFIYIFKNQKKIKQTKKILKKEEKEARQNILLKFFEIVPKKVPGGSHLHYQCHQCF